MADMLKKALTRFLGMELIVEDVAPHSKIAKLEVEMVFVREPTASPPCTLLQPATSLPPNVQAAVRYKPPDFAQGAFERIYPVRIVQQPSASPPLLTLYTLHSINSTTADKNVVHLEHMEGDLQGMVQSLLRAQALLKAEHTDRKGLAVMFASDGSGPGALNTFEVCIRSALLTAPFKQDASGRGEDRRAGVDAPTEAPITTEGTVNLQLLMRDLITVVDPRL
eukprot:gene25019-30518_t